MAGRRKKSVSRKIFDAATIRPPDVTVDDGTLNVWRMIERRARPDILDMGLWVEQWLQSSVGVLICDLVDRLELNAVHDSRQPGANSDRTLGQIQAFHALRNAWEGMVKDRQEMQRQIVQEAREEQTEEVEV